MDVKKLATDLGKNAEALASVLQELCKLDKNRTRNAGEIKGCLNQLNTSITQFIQFVERAEEVRELQERLSEYGSEIESILEQQKRSFGTDLETLLKDVDIKLTGCYPKLKAGFFTIETDWVKLQVKLWYGPCEEELALIPLQPDKVANRIKQVEEKLGCGLAEDACIDKLREAHLRVTHGRPKEDAHITDVLSEVAHLLQKTKFLEDPRREHFRNYTRADFSYDLFRARPLKKVHLRGATRAETKRRRDFLWVPDSRACNCEGYRYSHSKFKEDDQ